ncbi:MAG: PEP/pyruvate-binding domain-containing protein [Polyangiales bacterium]|nr:hypothetical protein [Sandaracinus sp.]
MPGLLRRVETLVPRRAAQFGGKARGLAALARAGFPVPAAYALSGVACETFFRANLEPHELPSALITSDVSAPALEAIAGKVRAAPLPADLERRLRDAFLSLRREGAVSVAVRSSSTREDQDEASAAGLHESILHVRDEDALLDAVRVCWASVFSPRVLAYLRRVGTGDADAVVGVVIQAMVPSDVSGVLFTVNPLTGDAGEIVIDAAYGLGSGVVDGSISPDTLRIDKASGVPRDRVIGDKAMRVVLSDVAGTREEPVEPEARQKLALTEAQVDELTQLALRVEHHFHGPRDVEWAIQHDTIYLLQARPVTVALQPGTRRWQKRRAEPKARARIVWSNVNVGEALPGVATPLTWSILSSFSELGFRRAFGSIGCTVPKDAELVGAFRGRIYLNLSEFMSILSQVPGLRPKTILALGGGGEVDRLEAEIENRGSAGFVARLPWTAARFAKENYDLQRRIEAFEELFAAERRRLQSLDLRVLASTPLDRVLGDVERLLDASGTVMLTVYGNLLSSVVVLTTALRVFAKERADVLQRDLLTGLADLDSAAPGMRLWYLAETARAEPEAKAALLAADPTHLTLEDLPSGPTRKALETFLEAFGHRGTREAEIAEPRWREDPTLLFTTLQLHLRGGGELGPLVVEERQRKVREAAEAELAKLVPAPLLPAFRHLLTLVQRFLRLRERLRGSVTEVLGFFRLVALDASRRLALLEPDAGTDGAFYLTLDELHQQLRHPGRATVASRIRQRRRQLERDRALPDPPDTFVGFPPPVSDTREPSADALRGLPASSGVVEGRVRVVRTPLEAAAFERGEILVVGQADVGWSPLFLVAGAVVTDLGGPLSHASIVLREYGVPAVVNVKHGTRVLKTGDRVRLDGDRGEVRLLERASVGDAAGVSA